MEVSSSTQRSDPHPTTPPILVCLPYAGGTALTFRHWRRWLAPRVEVLPIELPGRGSRLRMAPIDRMDPLVDFLLADLEAPAAGPYALFGHGTGALVAYELARRLTAAGKSPRHLLVSASRAPDSAETAKVAGDTAAPPEPSRAAFEADRRLAEAYRREAVAMEFPISVFGGVEDAGVPHDALECWCRHTVHPCAPRLLPGGHLYIHEHERLLTAAVRRILCGAEVPARQASQPRPAA